MEGARFNLNYYYCERRNVQLGNTDNVLLQQNVKIANMTGFQSIQLINEVLLDVEATPRIGEAIKSDQVDENCDNLFTSIDDIFSDHLFEGKPTEENIISDDTQVSQSSEILDREKCKEQEVEIEALPVEHTKSSEGVIIDDCLATGSKRQQKKVVKLVSEVFCKEKKEPESLTDQILTEDDENPLTKKPASKWKTLRQKTLIQTYAVETVKVGNKIGDVLKDLDDNDDLKVIGLSIQRALLSFSQALNHSNPAVGSITGPGILSFKESSQFSVRQPAFTCRAIEAKEFANIRQLVGISEIQYHAVLELQQKRKESDFNVIGSAAASGKSASFFFLSSDQRYILKTCTGKDAKTLIGILPLYIKHLQSSNKASLLPKYIGLYELKFESDIPSVVLLVMTNLLAASFLIHSRFDLKGSTYGRKASEKETKKKWPVFKDLDWIADGRTFMFPTKKEMETKLDQLEKDTQFLRNCNLIDYSLLIGVHKIDETNHEKYRFPEAMDVNHVKGSDDIYYFGLIDVLTPYETKKLLETVFIGYLSCRRGISCMPPKIYQNRFMSFCEREVFGYCRE